MTVLTEGRHPGEFIVSEANGLRSRSNIVLAEEETVVAGQVLGQILFDEPVVTPAEGNEGDGSVTLLELGPAAQRGTYRLECILDEDTTRVFAVFDPHGNRLANTTVGVAYDNGQLSFTLAEDGSDDWEEGDVIEIDVPAGSLEYGALDPDATDGRQLAAGVSFGNYDASLAPMPAVAMERDWIASADNLTWPDGIAEPAMAAAIARLRDKFGVVIRPGSIESDV